MTAEEIAAKSSFLKTESRDAIDVRTKGKDYAKGEQVDGATSTAVDAGDIADSGVTPAGAAAPAAAPAPAASAEPNQPQVESVPPADQGASPTQTPAPAPAPAAATPGTVTVNFGGHPVEMPIEQALELAGKSGSADAMMQAANALKEQSIMDISVGQWLQGATMEQREQLNAVLTGQGPAPAPAAAQPQPNPELGEAPSSEVTALRAENAEMRGVLDVLVQKEVGRTADTQTADTMKRLDAYPALKGQTGLQQLTVNAIDAHMNVNPRDDRVVVTATLAAKYAQWSKAAPTPPPVPAPGGGVTAPAASETGPNESGSVKPPTGDELSSRRGAGSNTATRAAAFIRQIRAERA